MALLPLLVALFPPASYPKPWLGAQPGAVVTPGINVTLTCRAPRPQPAWRFALFKAGEITPVLLRDVAAQLAEFFLEEVTQAQGGSYRCCYRKQEWEPGVWSPPSDALELLVTGCAGRVGGMSFALYRVGAAAPLQFRDSAQAWADFRLPAARAPGTYSCYYHTPWAPYVLSQRSEPLVVSWDGASPADYTRGNLVRLGLAGLLLLGLGALLAFDCRSATSAPGGIRP
ncbi:osteoclast-associated immunoglobulin-like receptor [Orycteropus afer afer]|uniref:Osteoclast-associated immunoglobulin-like receptor n=1 Tax=Orycteropus afer afer TaxID=1230840 RepID=A0AC54Z791_ORYAF|nr:osteoclast-associated immunoglobulin-like receptor [Orycteropus afer afer]